VRPSEQIAFLYFVYLVVVCWLRPLPARSRALLTALSLALIAVIPAVATKSSLLVRDWAQLVYIGFGYFLTGYLFTTPSAPLESWLMRWDRRLLGDPTIRFAHWPRWIVGPLDVLYMGCFLLLPGGLLALVAAGHAREADHYWTMVAAADLGAFAPLSVFQTRPPWQIETGARLAAQDVHRFALSMVRHATIGANTFPSGHVAVSVAVALGMMRTMPEAGAAVLGLAGAIGAACVIGRYHYVMDVITGALWGLMVGAAVTWAGI